MAGSERSGRTDELRVFEDLVRLGERVVDYQFRVVLDRLDRTDRLIQLGVATLAGMIAVVGLFLTQGGRVDLLGMSGFGTSILLVMVSVFLLARMNTGLFRSQFLSLGPNLDDLSVHVGSTRMNRLQYFRYLASHMPVHIEVNVDVIRSLAGRQDQALLVLAAGVGVKIATIVYILGGYIFG